MLRKVRGPAELLLLEDSYHMITIDRQRHLLVERSVRFFDRIVAAQATDRAAA